MDDPAASRVLIDRAVAGNEAAFQRLLVLYHPRLRARLQRMMDASLKARIEPEDILQQVYLEAFRAIGRFTYQGPDSFLRWLFSILERKLIDEHRAMHAERRDARREIKPPAPAPDNASYVDLLHRLDAGTTTPSRVIRSREALGMMQACLATLPEHYREVLHLRFIRGLPVADVAQRMRRSVGSIHMICHRALAQLREQLDRLGLSAEES